MSWTRRLPAYAVNGITVAIGIGLVQLVCTLLFGATAAQIATTGAIYASLPHVPGPTARTWRRVLLGGVLGCLAGVPIVAVQNAGAPHARAAVVAVLAFLAMMTMAWGQRAGPIAFAAVLSIVLSMALPPHVPVVGFATRTVTGAALYAVWSLVSNLLLEARYRTLALAEAVRATAQLLRARARVLVEPPPDGDEAGLLLSWIGDESSLAERLQAARDLLFSARDTPRTRREIAILLHVIELRDTLLASRLDLHLLGEDATASEVRERLGGGLNRMATALDLAHAAVRDGIPPPRDAEPELSVRRVFHDAQIREDDARGRILPAIVDRLEHLADDVGGVLALLRGRHEDLPLSALELERFVTAEAWPLSALASNLSLQSPVLRHALRTGAALGTATLLSRLLPWTSHPYWLVLSIAVVLRGTLEQTLSRRNARVLGTAAGCVLVMILSRSTPDSFMHAIFLGSVGAAHAFVNIRYVLTACAATVMALLQAHLVAPAAGFAIVERLADTLLGAMLAWGFSYVLPSWERRTLPQAVTGALSALSAYARCALAVEPDHAVIVEQRLARQAAYDALDAVASAVRRSAVEPARVRPPSPELLAFLDRAQRLMAHLSSVRLLLVRRRERLDGREVARAVQEARAALAAALSTSPGAASPEAPDDGDTPDALVPLEPPDRHLVPWLLRRVQVAVHDGARAGEAARASLRALGAL